MAQPSSASLEAGPLSRSPRDRARRRAGEPLGVAGERAHGPALAARRREQPAAHVSGRSGHELHAATSTRAFQKSPPWKTRKQRALPEKTLQIAENAVAGGPGCDRVGY